MPTESLGISESIGPVSRRDFLESSLLAAGVAGMPHLLARQLVAAEAGAASLPHKPLHPLDPLSPAELAKAVATIRDSKHFRDAFRFVSATLIEPARGSTGADSKQAPPRQAFLVVLDRAKATGYEAVVNLNEGALVRFAPLPDGVQPAIMPDEFVECEEVVKRSPQFVAALNKRGVSNAELVMVEPWSAGMYGTEAPEDKGRRLVRALCFVRSEAKDNGYARPLEGVVAVVDLHKMEVTRVEDYGLVPLPPEAGNWAGSYLPKPRADLKPLSIVQPEGPSFTVEGHDVRWQKWRFRIGFTPREGLVLHDISYLDQGRERPVLRRAVLCEMVVPYGDPGESSYRKNAFDIGEYGIGTMANSLALGCDCLGPTRYFDTSMLDSRGKVITLKNAVCLHEEDHGILWKHTDWRTGETETRRSRRLSVSFIATVGNYDYGFFWYLYQDGSIQFEAKLTGIMNTTTLAPGQKSTFGVEVAPRLNAPFHQHIFVARLDPCVDGPANSVYELNTVGLPTGPENPHGNAFRAESTLLGTEREAQRATNSGTARFWRVVNPGQKNRLGQNIGYRLVPGENCPPFVQNDAAVLRRAGFARHQLWVTPYDPDQRYAAGDYPNQHPTGDGLPKWTAANRSLENTELVLWYVFAHNHVPRPEDWPVMPVSTLGFQFKPDGFFDRNPALDVPPPV